MSMGGTNAAATLTSVSGPFWRGVGEEFYAWDSVRSKEKQMHTKTTFKQARIWRLARGSTSHAVPNVSQVGGETLAEEIL